MLRFCDNYPQKSNKTVYALDILEGKVFFVCKLNKKIYSCISDTIIPDEVIITSNQIVHIKERHPNDYEQYSKYFADIVCNPDYIIESNKKDTAVILKEIVEENRKIRMILKLATKDGQEGYKNSIITFMKINNNRWNRYLRTKNILYKRE